MKWAGHDLQKSCSISGELIAVVYRLPRTTEWLADIEAVGGHAVSEIGSFPTESAAKSAVAAWIGKTIAQLGNALAAGEPRIDEE